MGILKKIKKYVLLQVEQKQKLNNIVQAEINNKYKYLSSGKYFIVISDSGKIITYIDDKQALNFISKVLIINYENTITGTVKREGKKILDTIINNISNIKIQNNKYFHFKGNLLMFTYNREFKIFDFKKKKVMNFLKDKKTFENLQDTYHLFSKYFNIPIIDFIKEENAVIEQYINYDAYENWTIKQKEMAVDCIFECHKSYFSNMDKSQIIKKTISSMFIKIQDDIKHRELMNLLKVHTNNVIYEEEIFVKCHGDMVFSNILLHESKYYFIDWVDSGYYVFYYDLFNFMFGEAAFHNNYYYITKFLEGEYDKELYDLFRLFNIEYKSNEKMYYIAVFITERIKFRITNKNDQNLNSVFETYYTTLKKVQDIKHMTAKESK